MGAWERGIINANAGALGNANNEIARLRQDLDANVQYAVKKIARLQHAQQDYQDFLATKEAHKEDVVESLEIFGAVRPDKVPSDASLGVKRATNLRLFAWTEWFQQTLHGQLSLGEKKAPILRNLSRILSENDGVATNPKAAISALNDIASRMEFGSDMDNGHEWVEKRIQEMAENVQWERKDPTIPIAASIVQVVPNLVDWEKRVGKIYDPFTDNDYGINDMAVR